MNMTQASEATEQPKFSPYPLILYALGSAVVLWLCIGDFLGMIFYPQAYLTVHLFPGFLCAQVTMLGIIGGLVGRHWLTGMALGLGLQILIFALAYGLEIANLPDDNPFVLGNIAIRQYSVLSVVLTSVPALVMRKLKSWRITLNPTQYKSKSIFELLIATTFVAMVTASEIQSHQPVLDYSIYVAAIGACLVALLLPVVRKLLSDSNWKPRPKLGVYVYALAIGGTGSLVTGLFFNPFAGFIAAFHYSIFAVCVWMGICCLGATGLRFRSQQLNYIALDDKAHSLSRETFTHGEGRSTGSPDVVHSPFSDDMSNEPLSARASPEILGRWSLVMIAVLIAGFTMFKIWATRP